MGWHLHRRVKRHTSMTWGTWMLSPYRIYSGKRISSQSPFARFGVRHVSRRTSHRAGHPRHQARTHGVRSDARPRGSVARADARAPYSQAAASTSQGWKKCLPANSAAKGIPFSSAPRFRNPGRNDTMTYPAPVACFPQRLHPVPNHLLPASRHSVGEIRLLA